MYLPDLPGERGKTQSAIASYQSRGMDLMRNYVVKTPGLTAMSDYLARRPTMTAAPVDSKYAALSSPDGKFYTSATDRSPARTESSTLHHERRELSDLANVDLRNALMEIKTGHKPEQRSNYFIN